MKFDKYIAAYLQQHHSFDLAGIGTFHLANAAPTNPSNAQDAKMILAGISFIWDKSVVTEPTFLQFLASSIQKPSSVVLADYEEYILQVKTWLAMGKSVAIQQIGTIHQSSNTGQVIYEAGFSSSEKVSFPELNIDQQLYSSIPKSSSTFGKKIKPVFLLSTLFVLGLLVLIVVAFSKGWIELPKQTTTPVQNNQVPPVITVQPKDTTTVRNDTPVQPRVDTQPKPLAINNPNDTVRYKVIFLASKYRDKAFKLFRQYPSVDKINIDSAVMKDTLRYRLFIYKKAVAKDTNQVKLDFEKYFKHYIILEPSTK